MSNQTTSLTRLLLCDAVYVLVGDHVYRVVRSSRILCENMTHYHRWDEVSDLIRTFARAHNTSTECAHSVPAPRPRQPCP